MITNERAWKLLRIALPIAGLIILFFSGIFPLENLLSFVSHKQLTASVSSSEVIALTNENRVVDHLSALTTSALLTQAAQLKANDMAANSYYAHVSPDGKTPLYWLELVGYHYLNAGENLVIDRTTSEEVVSAWMNSADHRENILRPQFTEIGVGVAQGVYQGQATTYVVQEFGTPYPTPPVVRKTVATTVAPTQAQSTATNAPVNTLKPQPIPAPSVSKNHDALTVGTSTPSNTLVNNIVALVAPVTETIQVQRVSTTTGTTTLDVATTTATATPVFTLPAQANIVVALQGTGESTAPAAPLSNYQTTLGKQRIEAIRAHLGSLWSSIVSFIF